MAGTDQDHAQDSGFSNVSWSEHVHEQTSRAAPPGEEPRGEPAREAEALGEERLECTVGAPLKENDGSKDAFVSYLITTNVVARVVRREADLETDLKDLAEQFQKLITLEPGVEPAVHAFAASVEDTAAHLRQLRDLTDQDYLGSLRDMQAYSLSLRNLLRAREQKQLDYEQLTEYLNKSTAERDALHSGHGAHGGGPGGFIRAKIEDVRGVDHEQARRERTRKLELRVEELTTEVERARHTSDLFDDEVVREVADFERIKRAEFKAQLGALADAHVAFYGDVAELWEAYVLEMQEGAAAAAAAAAVAV
ncbi:Sorting nexin-4 [Tolypocladium ophioglossoides CBS 100239]|uniref:Sorting nexin-4 n=1 Tax=Tolypocladium ophioglossoides (strain CBS 100239) TaxID=1163406 RepID=A0A0L0N2W1_TOLOC|nr:Sorting nexin-4 [Tolypocladium ophioglossoides CBS 100239]